MCRMSRHTTLLLIGIWNSKKFLVKNPFECTRLLFTGAEKMAKLAWNFCSIPWVKPLSTFAIMEEGYLIYNFAVQWKAWFSFKFQRKSGSKTVSANWNLPGNAGARSAATSSTATSASRRTRRTRVGRATAVGSGGEKTEGIIAKDLKLPGAYVHKDSIPFSCVAETCKIDIKL
jgi:hypothetical protein